MSKRFKLIHLVILLCLGAFAWSTSNAAYRKDGLLRVWFLDVGQGDAIFIQAPNGNQILIDGGPDGSVVNALGRIMPFYDHDIDAVIVSHPHSDHIAGLIEVLNRYDVHAVIQAEETYDSPQFLAWRQAIADEHAPEIEAVAGRQIDLGNGVTLRILYPFASVAGTSTKTPHDDVVVAMLQYGANKILLTGDMEARVERSLIVRESDIDADVLKIGHHGSKTSTSELFLKAVTPQVGVIEVGAHNMYRLPSPAVLDRLAQFGIPYYRTDENGTVELISDGAKFQITHEK